MRRKPSVKEVRRGVTAEASELFMKKPLRRKGMRLSAVMISALFLLSCAGKEGDVVYLEEEAFSSLKKVKEVCEEDVDSVYCREIYIKPVYVRKESLYEKERKRVLLNLLKVPPSPVRTPDEVLKIYILPYTDSKGNFHAGGYIFTVVEDGRWILADEADMGEKPKVLTPLGEDER